MVNFQSVCGAAVQFAGVAKHFAERRVLSELTVDVAAGEFVAIVGRSGSGKSTLLRLLCGLEQPNEGCSRVLDGKGRDARAAVRVVFQEPRLLPWKNVRENVSIGITAHGPAERRRRDEAARAVLAAVGLRDRCDDFPAVLSGGQRQRVALARALLQEPSVLLLDEPFGALDALTRIETQNLLESLWLERRFTALLVTHDVQEAVLLADRVLLIEEGRFAASFDVPLSRPRRRDDSELARISGVVLERIFVSPAATSAARQLVAASADAAIMSVAGAKPAHV